jgi:hypothetical protein
MTTKSACLTAAQIALLNEASEPYGEDSIPLAWDVTDPALALPDDVFQIFLRRINSQTLH